MMLGIVARFPLGTYTGHRADGSPDPFPDPARLHAALMNAACQGSTAILDRGKLCPSSEALAALRWLEANPPTGLRIPDTVPVNTETVVAYRKEGVIRKEGSDWKDKVTTRRLSDGRSFGEHMGWHWNHEVPEAVRETIDALCADVSCLGEATSPVVLELAEVEPNLELHSGASRFAPSGHSVRVAVDGRVDALLDAHRASTAKPPTVSQDRHSTTELPAPPPVASAGLATVRYFGREPARSNDAPWSEVILLPTDQDIAYRDRVSWCTALHRALVARIGSGAPPLITGVYDRGVQPPANRLAIQYLHRSLLVHHGLDSNAFALLIPSDADPIDLVVLQRALTGLTRLRSKQGIASIGSEGPAVDATRFWAPPAEHETRLWRTCPAAVPETRPQRRTDAVPPWTLEDAALLSIAFVWRDLWRLEPGRGSRWYRKLVSAVRERGISVRQSRILPVRDAARYAHKLPSGVIAQPYTATIDLGEAHSPTMMMAIGQSRHLGGGMLAPLDLPTDLVDSFGEGGI